MATRQIKDAKDLSTNELIYFKGHAKATYMSNGKTVEDAINAIGSGGSCSSGSGAYGLVEHGISDTTFSLTPNTFHVWDEVGELTLTLGEETVGVANEYLFQFTSGTEPTVLTLPDSIVWANDEIPTIESNYVYQVSVLKGFATLMKFKNTNLIVNNFVFSGSDFDGIYITFDYPPASEIIIEFKSELLDETIQKTLFIEDIETRYLIADGPEAAGFIFISITPEQDDIYKYVYNG